MFGFGAKKCFFCQNKVQKSEAFKSMVMTGDGEIEIISCKPCGLLLNDVLKEIEDVISERTDSV